MRYRFVILRCLVAVLVVLAVAGCKGKAKKAAAKAETETGAPFMPKAIPGLDEAGAGKRDSGSTEVVIKGAYDRGAKEEYVQNDKCPAGIFRGTCRFAASEKVEPPPDDPLIDLNGVDAISNPEPKEVAFYTNIEIKKPTWVFKIPVHKGPIECRPGNVVVMLKDVPTGKRPTLDRPVMAIRNGAISPSNANNGGLNNVQIGPLHERAQFTTWDVFASHLVVTFSGTKKVVFEKDVRYAHVTTTGKLEFEPEMATTEPMRQAGRYDITDTRHPWLKGYLFVVNNPYVAIVPFDPRRPTANFEINGVPPGTHKVEAWHPTCKPVESTMEVEIEADKATEVIIYFHAPSGKP